MGTLLEMAEDSEGDEDSEEDWDSQDEEATLNNSGGNSQIYVCIISYKCFLHVIKPKKTQLAMIFSAWINGNGIELSESEFLSITLNHNSFTLSK